MEEQVKLIDNVNQTLKEDLKNQIKKSSKISIAAASFSIYAFDQLKKELKNIDELRFIFTSPIFIKEKSKKEKVVKNNTKLIRELMENI